MSPCAARVVITTLVAVSSWCSASAHAYCREYIEDQKSEFSYTYICENSLRTPPYLIVRQYVGELEFELFELGYRDLRLLCSRAVLDQVKTFGDCTRYGVRSLSQQYDNGAYTIKTGGLDRDELEHLYEKPSLFRYPEFAPQVPETGCAILLTTDKTIYWRFAMGQPESLSECLLNFELHATQEKWRF